MTGRKLRTHRLDMALGGQKGTVVPRPSRAPVENPEASGQIKDIVAGLSLTVVALVMAMYVVKDAIG